MIEVPVEMRAWLDQELQSAVDALLGKAAEYDGADIIEANVALSVDLSELFNPVQLAAATAALALRMHRSRLGGLS